MSKKTATASSTTDEEREVERKVFDLVDAQIRSQCLYILYKLSIPDILAEHKTPLPLTKLVAKVEERLVDVDISEGNTITDIDADKLQRVMRYMACHGVCDERVKGEGIAFGANKVTEVLAKSNHQSLNFWSHEYPLFNPVISNMWKAVEKKVDTGSVFEDLYGSDIFSFMKKNSSKESADLFGRDMESLSVNPSQCAEYISKELKHENENKKKLVHIGGNTGEMVTLLKKKCPDLRCVDFDTVEAIAETTGVEGVERIGGDMFDPSTIPMCDVFFMRFILYQHDSDKCKAILENCAKSLANGGRVMAIEPYYPNPGQASKEDVNSFFADLFMMATTGARERTRSDWNDVFAEAGYAVEKVRLIPSRGFNPIAILLIAKPNS